MALMWVPDERVMFSGDLIEYHSACYCGDAHLRAWPGTLNAIRYFDPKSVAPGRGDALNGQNTVREALAMTRDFVTSLYGAAEMSVVKGRTLKEAFGATREAMDNKFGSFAIYEHCLPFNVETPFAARRHQNYYHGWRRRQSGRNGLPCVSGH